jgi:hypothetical protein
MKRYRWLIIAVVLLIVVAAAVVGFVLGDIQSVKGMTVKRATPHQLAEAMRGDRSTPTTGLMRSSSAARSRQSAGAAVI